MDDKNILPEIMNQLPEEIKLKAMNSAVSLLKVLFKDPMVEFGNFITDKIKAKRYAHMIDVIASVNEKLIAAGISPNEPSLKVIIPLLENCSLEEDKNLKEKWSFLLKNALDPAQNNDIHLAYINILRELTPNEALILDFLFNELGADCFDILYACQLVETKLKIDSDIFYIYMDNFERLKLIESNLDLNIFSYLKNRNNEENQIQGKYHSLISNVNKFNVEISEFSFTFLGRSFMVSCNT
ncbi:hypothetical protein C8Z91_04465 [Paenibacillus elgii]|uniref:DUF4393 domain-containing protein n=1 Tax=Paenibacillus elgii TaxID=189691 RepID=A0A2T6G872_9BACL|nr:Abi-alpha family protein [Paenibacillus elgii]PUA40363.1 hypothetical protein C8Z91_04465 [Paenibacillus elgii]